MPGSVGKTLPAAEDLRFRAACLADAHAIAGLHADSWRHHYRGAYSDAFLDGDVFGNRLSVWSERPTKPDPESRTILAESARGLFGFAHTVLDEDVCWGALIDNLHVRRGLKRRGIGTQLLQRTAQAVLDRSPSSGLYLWVLEQNSDAQSFLRASRRQMRWARGCSASRR
jgi:GNAT superfamily N-acetyltransferase